MDENIKRGRHRSGSGVKKIIRTIWRPILGITIILIVWVACSSIMKNEGLLPFPGEVFSKMGYVFSSSEFQYDVWATIYRWIFGMSGGVLSGVIIGSLMAYSRVVHGILDFPVDFFRSLPVTSLYPVFLMIGGIGNGSKIAMAWAAVIFIVIVNTYQGAKHISPIRLQMAKTFGATRWQIFRDIVFWEILPFILVGIKIAISISLIVVIISEMFMGANYGLGKKLWDAYSNNATELMYGIIIILGVLGYCLNKLFNLIENSRYFIWTKPGSHD